MIMKSRFVKLGNVCKIQSGGTPRRGVEGYYGGEIPWAKIGDIENSQNGYIINTAESITSAGLRSINNRLFPTNTVFLAMYGSVGKTAISGIEMTTNQAILGLQPNNPEELYFKYLKYWLDFSKKDLIGKARGVALQNISATIVKEFEIPLLPIEEQKKVVKVLDNAYSIYQKRKQSINLLNDYLKSTFFEIFGDLVTNTKEWKTFKLGEIADICSGVTKGRKFGNSKTVFAPYMRVANVQDEHINLSEIKEIEVLPGDVEKYKLVNGDILLTEGGDPDKLGRGGIWRGEIENCIHQNHIFRVRLNNKLTLPEFMSAQIGSRRGKQYFLKSAKQTTGIATINITQLKNYPALVPPLDLQEKYKTAESHVRILKEKMQDQLIELDNQFQSLMQNAFNGEI